MVRLEALVYLEEIAKTKSISKAADRLFLSKSAISTAIKHLEEELGVKLLNRSVYGVELTAVGEMVVRKANVILELVNQMEAECWVYDEKSSGETITCLMTNSFATNYFPKLLKPLRLVSGGSRLTTVCTNLEGIIEQVGHEKLNIGFYMTVHSDLAKLVDTKDVVVSLVDSYKLSLIVSRYSRHIPEHITELEMKEIFDFPIIRYMWIDDQYGYFQEKYSERDENYEPVFRTDNMSIYCQAIADDIGVGLLPWVGIFREFFAKSMLRPIPLKNGPVTNLFLITNHACPHELRAKYENVLMSIGDDMNLNRF